jgi:hypothetical protein
MGFGAARFSQFTRYLFPMQIDEAIPGTRRPPGDGPAFAMTSNHHGDPVAAAQESARPDAEITQGLRKHGVGHEERAKRDKEWIYLEALGYRRNNPALTKAEAETLAEAALERARAKYGVAYIKAFDATTPTSKTPCSDNIDRRIELAAMFREAGMRWIRSHLSARTGRRGRRPNRALAVAAILQMAMGKGRPEIQATVGALSSGEALLSYAHDLPPVLTKRSETYEAIKKTLVERNPDLFVYANLDLLRRLARLRDHKGNLRHPNAFQVAVIDATKIEADVLQKSAVDEGHRRLLHGPERLMVRHLVYRRENGSIRLSWVGYKLLIISDLSLTLPIAWCLCPAGDEKEYAKRLLAFLFKLWPDCPLHTLVGDSLFDHSKEFNHHLVFDLGIQPIFVKHGSYSQSLDHVGTDGVPRCSRSGCEGGLMKLIDTSQFLTAAARAKQGIPRGETAGLQGHLRWLCETCKARTNTYPIKDPRLYTWYPRTGDHRRATLRRVYGVRQNAAESINASLKNFGLGGTAQDRPDWAGDVEMCWLLAGGLYAITARRFAHETGAYEAALLEATELGYKEPCSVENPSPGPSKEELARAWERRREADEPIRPPAGWDDQPLEEAGSLAA